MIDDAGDQVQGIGKRKNQVVQHHDRVTDHAFLFLPPAGSVLLVFPHLLGEPHDPVAARLLGCRTPRRRPLSYRMNYGTLQRKRHRREPAGHRSAAMWKRSTAPFSGTFRRSLAIDTSFLIRKHEARYSIILLVASTSRFAENRVGS